MNKQSLVVCTVLVETSPQALPLGAACIVSALKADSEVCAFYKPVLISFSREDAFLVNKSSQEAGKLVAQRLISALSGSSVPSGVEFVGEHVPPAVCFSLYMWNRDILVVAANELRSAVPGIILVAGGPEVTARPDSFGDTFDYTIPRAGEIPVPALFRQIIQKKRDLSSKLSVETEITSFESSLNSDTGQSPYLDGTLDPAEYDGALWELARGCPFACSYCYESKGEKKVTYFPESRLKAELDLFAQKKIGQVFVLDPTYNANTQRALEILRYIKKAAPEIYFNFEVRAEYLNNQLARAFAEIPCSLQIGLQSADEQVLKLVHRSFDRKQFVQRIGLLNKNGAVFGFDLIYGLPGDSLSGFRSSIDFAISLYPNHLELFKLSVLPGTDLFDRAESGELKLEYMKTPPYHVISTPSFPKQDIARAEQIAKATNMFYSAGRAVGWFNAVLKPLKQKPSQFFSDFAMYLEMKEKRLATQKSDCVQMLDCTSHQEIEKLQLAFIRQKYSEKNLQRLLTCAEDIIKLNGALGRATAEKTTEKLRLNYNPDDLLSEYSTDLEFFSKNVNRHNCTTSVFPADVGADYRVIIN